MWKCVRGTHEPRTHNKYGNRCLAPLKGTHIIKGILGHRNDVTTNVALSQKAVGSRERNMETSQTRDSILQKPEEKALRSLALAYALGLVAVAALLITAQVVVQSMLASQESDAATINIAGRQRMLSQRIAKNILNLRILPPGPATENVIFTIEGDLAKWRAAHRKLRSGFTGRESTARTSPAVQARFDDVERHFQLMVTTTENIIRTSRAGDEPASVIATRDAIIAEHESEFLKLMDGIVMAYEREARDRVHRLRQVEFGLTLAVIAVVSLQALLVFRPLVRRMRTTIVELARSKQIAEDLSLEDELTGIANRRKFEQELKREWLRAARNGSPVSVIMIDLDDFKGLNDSAGHDAGDQCLALVGSLLADEMRRATDLVARYGGDEFVVFLPDTDQKGAEAVASRLQEKVDELSIATFDRWHVAISTGVAAENPNRSDVDYAHLITEADRRMLRAKTERKHRSQFWGTAGAGSLR